MTRFLLWYYFEKLALWFVFSPIVAGLLVLPFTLFNESPAIFLYPLLVTTTIVLTVFLEHTTIYQLMLRTMPIPARTFVHVKFLFSGLLIVYQLTLLTVALSNRAYETLPPIMTALALCTVLVNLMLLYHFYTGQQKKLAMLALLCFLQPFIGFQQFEALLLTNETIRFVLPSLVAFSFLNYSLCLYFAKIKDAS